MDFQDLSKPPMGPNDFDPRPPEIVKQLRQLFRDDFTAWNVYRALHKSWGQVNDDTKLKRLERYPELGGYPQWDRKFIYVEIPAFIPMPEYRPKWYPKAGFLPFLQRIRARIHKWLSDAPYKLHPFDAPPGWKPLDISAYGHIDINPSYFRSRPVMALELKRYGYVDYHLGAITMTCAYDPLSDTLHYRMP